MEMGDQTQTPKLIQIFGNSEVTTAKVKHLTFTDSALTHFGDWKASPDAAAATSRPATLAGDGVAHRRDIIVVFMLLCLMLQQQRERNGSSGNVISITFPLIMSRSSHI